MENTYNNQLLQTKLEVQEQSFKHFSEEIHDNVGQLLSIVKMQLYTISGSEIGENTRIQLDGSTELLGKAISELRNISHTLNSSYISSVGLVAAVGKELEYINLSGGIVTAIEVTGNEASLGNEKELLTFRIIQEAIANSIKHAAPTTLRVSIRCDDAQLTVSIEDNGSGFDINAFNAGLGLANMHVRAGILGGAITIDSAKNSGTTITLVIPTDKKQQNTQ